MGHAVASVRRDQGVIATHCIGFKHWVKELMPT